MTTIDIDSSYITPTEELERLQDMLDNIYDYMCGPGISNVYFHDLSERYVPGTEQAALDIIEMKDILSKRIEILRDKQKYEQLQQRRNADTTHVLAYLDNTKWLREYIKRVV